MKFIFPNFRLIFWELCFGLFSYITHPAFSEPVDKSEYITAIAIFVIVVIAMIGYLILSPHFFVFDEKGVRIYYILGLKETANWKDVTSIRKTYDHASKYSKSVYEISPMEGGKAFFMESCVNKNWYIRRVIEHYWDGTIEDDGFFARRRRNKSLPRDTARAEAEERWAKTSVHEVLKRCKGDFENAGVTLDVKFTYDGEKKRPPANYHFTATVILKSQQGDGEFELDFPVLRVIRGKEEYRPVHMKGAFNEIEEALKEESAILKAEERDRFFSEV